METVKGGIRGQLGFEIYSSTALDFEAVSDETGTFPMVR
jgi:hypothetical protein